MGVNRGGMCVPSFWPVTPRSWVTAVRRMRSDHDKYQYSTERRESLLLTWKSRKISQQKGHLDEALYYMWSGLWPMEQGGQFRWQLPHVQSNWDEGTDGHREKMWKLLLSTRIFSLIFPYKVKSHFFDQNLFFHVWGFSRLTTCLGHITVLPDKLGHYWPQHVLIKKQCSLQ